MALPYSPGTAKASTANAPSTPSSTPGGQFRKDRPMPNTISASPSAAATYTRAAPQSWRNTIQFSVARQAAQFQVVVVRPVLSKRSKTAR